MNTSLLVFKLLFYLNSLLFLKKNLFPQTMHIYHCLAVFVFKITFLLDFFL